MQGLNCFNFSSVVFQSELEFYIDNTDNKCLREMSNLDFRSKTLILIGQQY